MDQPAGFTIEQRNGASVAVLHGDWTSTGLGGAERELRAAFRERPGLKLDLRGIGRCDVAGAYSLRRAAGRALAPEEIGERAGIARLMELVNRGSRDGPAPPPRSETPLMDLMARIGHGVVGIGHEFWDTMGFNGHLTLVLIRSISDPRRIRWAPFVSLAERAGLDALPIVAVTSFFIGAVIAFIGADLLASFSLQVFTVELVGVSELREFGVVITAVLLAGRSASSFAAEIGAMKMNQEIDAMQVMGVDPFEALVMPRFLALLFTIPLLTFIAVLAGLFGGMMVAWAQLDLSPVFFVQRVAETVGVKHFWVGMSKAPVLAIVIASIGCRQGMEVGGDVESLGRRVTAAVVHAIFSIILLDAVFAMIYTELKI
jgi:phospholipid/cholesterol/gamma-HCH transport system permease protein